MAKINFRFSEAEVPADFRKLTPRWLVPHPGQTGRLLCHRGIKEVDIEIASVLGLGLWNGEDWWVNVRGDANGERGGVWAAKSFAKYGTIEPEPEPEPEPVRDDPYIVCKTAEDCVQVFGSANPHAATIFSKGFIIIKRKPSASAGHGKGA